MTESKKFFKPMNPDTPRLTLGGWEEKSIGKIEKRYARPRCLMTSHPSACEHPSWPPQRSKGEQVLKRRLDRYLLH
jgi:hypothetical protein